MVTSDGENVPVVPAGLYYKAPDVPDKTVTAIGLDQSKYASNVAENCV